MTCSDPAGGGADTFERLFTGVVLSGRERPLDAWESFYRNTLRRLDTAAPAAGPPEGCLAGIAPVSRRAESLVAEPLDGPGRVLGLGSCFVSSRSGWRPAARAAACE